MLRTGPLNKAIFLTAAVLETGLFGFFVFFFNVKTLPLKAQLADSNRDNPTGKHYMSSYMTRLMKFKPAQLLLHNLICLF